MTQTQSKADKLASLYASLDSIVARSADKPVLPMGTGDTISKVKLSENDVASVLESVVPGYKPIQKKIKKTEVEQPTKVQEEVSPEDKIRDLIIKLTTLLGEAKVVIAEMTTTGMIGTNQKFVLGQKKKKLQKPVKKVK